MALTIVGLHIFIFVLSLGLFLFRYKKNSQGFFLNYLFYLLFFSLFYISIPSIESLLTEHSPVGASIDTIINTSLIGLYFVFVFFVAYFFSKDKLFFLDSYKLRKTKHLNSLLKIVSGLIFIYIVSVIVSNFQIILNVWGFRGAQSSLNNFLEIQFKVKPLFNIHVLLVSFLFLTEKKFRCLYALLPYMIYDLLLSGRMYLFAILLLVFIFSVLSNKIIKLKYLIGGILLVALIGVFRSPADFELIHMLLIFKEMTYTWATTHLMYESNSSQDFLYSMNYSILRIFPSCVYELFFGEYSSYTKITGNANPLGWGLAGSIVAEAISFKNSFVILIYPILIVIYGAIINILLRINYSSSIIIFIITLLYVQQMFRYSFLEFALYPFYIILFLGFYIIASDFKRIKATANLKFK